MDSTWLIVGLGNPGTEYANTRHNVGFEVIEALSKRFNIPVRKRTMRSVLGDGRFAGDRIILCRPMTYMNLSGEAVAAVARMYRIPINHILIVVDDIALPLGKLRLRESGSAGGHNGLTSIEQRLGSKDYPRLRIGVGSAEAGRMIDHVLGKFTAGERTLVDEAVERASETIEHVIRSGTQQAMNFANRSDVK